MNQSDSLFKNGSGGCELTAGSTLGVRVVTSQSAERKRFEELLEQKHYLGQTPPVGDFLRQVIVREGVWVALLVWGPAALKLKDREKWIGWNSAMASERLKLVAQNRRYLLLHDRGSEPNLASQALAAACRALPGQWEQHFGYQVLIAESFTDPEGYTGTCYKACGWEPVGFTEGNSRHRRDLYLPNDRPKCLWLKELCPRARSKITAAPLAPQHARGHTPPVQGVLGLTQAQRHSLRWALQKAPDPRARNSRFAIGPILAIVTMAVMGGALQITQIARFANRLTQKQRAQLGLPRKAGTQFYRVPSYSVFYDVLTRLDCDAFATHLNTWMAQSLDALPQTLAMDGKMIKDIVGTLSLVEVEDGSPVAMAVIDSKEATQRCEMKMAQKLIENMPSLEGKTVTADPLHCQKDTARAILGKGGEYLLQIKGNQPGLREVAEVKSSPQPPLLP
jgi:hypothetical protein